MHDLNTFSRMGLCNKTKPSVKSCESVISSVICNCTLRYQGLATGVEKTGASLF